MSVCLCVRTNCIGVLRDMREQMLYLFVQKQHQNLHQRDLKRRNKIEYSYQFFSVVGTTMILLGGRRQEAKNRGENKDDNHQSRK